MTLPRSSGSTSSSRTAPRIVGMQLDGDGVRLANELLREELQQLDGASVRDLGSERRARRAVAAATRRSARPARGAAFGPSAKPRRRPLAFVFRLDLVDDRLAGRDLARAERRLALFFLRRASSPKSPNSSSNALTDYSAPSRDFGLRLVVGNRAALDEALLGEETADRIRRLRALREPRLDLLVVDDDRLGFGARIIVSEDLDERGRRAASARR